MGGFTPSFDCVLQDVGLVGAAVFGRIWRYCQGYRGVCDASIETIAGELNISTRTVLRWTKKLCTLGYLEDLTPDLRNKPHTYRDTGKVSLQVQVVAVTQTTSDEQPGMTESHSTMTESQSHYDLKSLEETCKRQDKRQEGPACAGTPTVESPPVVEEEPEPEPKPKAKARRKRDPRIDHPAIQEYRRATSLYPEKTWWEDIIEIVGTEEADVEFWYNVCHDYVGNNWNKKNVKNMLAYYSTRTLPEVSGAKNGGNGHGSHTPRPAQPVQEVQFHGRLPRI
jgi:hypothetical protein